MYFLGRRLTLSILKILEASQQNKSHQTNLLCKDEGVLPFKFTAWCWRSRRPPLQGSQVKQIHDLCQKIINLRKANNYPVRIRLRWLVQKCSCKPREVLFCDAALAQPPVTCMPRWRAFCPITQPPRIFQTTCLHTYMY